MQGLTALVHAPQEDTSIAILGRAAFGRWSREESAAAQFLAGLQILKNV